MIQVAEVANVKPAVPIENLERSKNVSCTSFSLCIAGTSLRTILAPDLAPLQGYRSEALEYRQARRQTHWENS